MPRLALPSGRLWVNRVSKSIPIQILGIRYYIIHLCAFKEYSMKHACDNNNNT